MGEHEFSVLCAWFGCKARIRAETKPSGTMGPVASQYGEWLRTIERPEPEILGVRSVIIVEEHCFSEDAVKRMKYYWGYFVMND